MINTETLLLQPHNGVLHITLNRPQSRNAMSLQMVNELRAVLADVACDDQVRALVLSGAGGHFSAGGDVKDMSSAGSLEALRDLNRIFGTLLQEVEALPQVVIVVLQGAVLGGGFGLACVSDIALADHQAQFGLPETGLGLLPAQIAPFVVKRIGLTQARRLALTAARFDGIEAQRLGLVHFVEHDAQGLAERLDEVLGQVLRCAPGANARTKALLLGSVGQPLGPVLDQAAQWFAEAVAGEEGIEGTQAFVQKRKPRWAG
ncbi:enoyl-CoA hydratase-related protein [Pseudomonas sp. 15FMM2]|uniref:Enoyl-CoA hydratase-related protein n=1 Tax=Pseudomonas imrae TaxID=2992837 RepID=A0ACC7PBM3_9PSED